MGHCACLAASLTAAGVLLAGCAPTPTMESESANAAHRAQAEVNGATATATRMHTVPGMTALLSAAKGVLVVPRYGRGAYFLGGQGGNGVLMLRGSGGEWSQPAFYILGGTSLGLQANGEAGPVALVLMSDNAVARFRDNTNTWRLGADTGLTVNDFSGQETLASANPKADIVMWSGTSGLHAGMSGGATYITPDTSLNDAYYRGMVTNQEILSNMIRNSQTANLREALAGRVGAAYR